MWLGLISWGSLEASNQPGAKQNENGTVVCIHRPNTGEMRTQITSSFQSTLGCVVRSRPTWARPYLRDRTKERMREEDTTQAAASPPITVSRFKPWRLVFWFLFVTRKIGQWRSQRGMCSPTNKWTGRPSSERSCPLPHLIGNRYFDSLASVAEEKRLGCTIYVCIKTWENKNIKMHIKTNRKGALII